MNAKSKTVIRYLQICLTFASLALFVLAWINYYFSDDQSFVDLYGTPYLWLGVASAIIAVLVGILSREKTKLNSRLMMASLIVIGSVVSGIVGLAVVLLLIILALSAAGM